MLSATLVEFAFLLNPIACRCIGCLQYWSLATIGWLYKMSVGGFFGMRIKDRCKKAIRFFGYRIVNVKRRWGIDVYDDIRRIVSDLGEIVTVFDVGANVGMTALRMVGEYPNASVFSFEPVKSTFNQLVDNTKDNKKIKCLRLGLGNKVGRVACALHADNRNNSLIQNLNDKLHSNPIGDEVIDLETLDTVTERLGISSIDLLKIDTEGGDLAVLQGASGLLARQSIRFIYFEFHHLLSNDAQQRLGNLVEIAEFLREYHYRFITVYTDSVHGRECLGTYNALFMLDDNKYHWEY